MGPAGPGSAYILERNQNLRKQSTEDTTDGRQREANGIAVESNSMGELTDERYRSFHRRQSND